MKARSNDLAAHQAEPVTTLAWCWKVTRRDGLTFGFTSIDFPLLIGGVTYEASTGVTPGSIEDKADLSVPNLQVAGLLDAVSITEEDLRAGLWDLATVEIFEVNYSDLGMGIMALRSGSLGQCSAGRTGFRAELRGLAQKLQQPLGRVFTAGCQALLGDAECKVDLVPLTHSATVTAATSGRQFTAASLLQADDYFGGGLVRWTSGANEGVNMEVLSFGAGEFVLVLPLPHVIEVGDAFEVVAGCRKRKAEDCRDKYSNVVNFRGHPHVPGNDKVLGLGGLKSV